MNIFERHAAALERADVIAMGFKACRDAQVAGTLPGVFCFGILGAPGYFITDRAIVFSTHRGVMKIVKPTMLGKYSYVQCGSHRTGRRAYTHRLMAECFLDWPEDGQTVVRHLDGDPTNNSLRNLAWGTSKDNAQDTIRHGRTPTGEKNFNARLTWQKVAEIRALALSGVPQRKLAKQFGVQVMQINRIVRGEAWK